jgi:uncharacterized lipoprotein YmbA
VKLPLAALGVLSLVCACAANHPDQFYLLSVQPPGAVDTRTTPATEVALKVALPSMVDRGEMIIETAAHGVLVVEHERWAAPLTDMVTQTLARDLEQRRADLLVSGPGVSFASRPVVKISIDLLQVTISQDERVSIEAHWHISDARAGKDLVGGEVFTVPLPKQSYAAVAAALSACLGQLADGLITQI